MLDELEKRIIHFLQGDLPLMPRPFAAIARELDVSEEELIKKIKQLKVQGILRRFGASLDHRRAGYRANAMVAWYALEDKLESAGKIMAGFKEVSHCYQRQIRGDWKYNLFTMIHGKNRGDCERSARRIADETGIEDYVVLLTLKEYKKASPQYF
jgi:DNA-binding Lrp family transcriptional regulator